MRSKRAYRSDLEKMVSEVVVKAVIETHPELRDAIRTVLDRGVKPDALRRKYGCRAKRPSQTAITIGWLIDEWERDKGKIGPEESIDRVEDIL